MVPSAWAKRGGNSDSSSVGRPEAERAANERPRPAEDRVPRAEDGADAERQPDRRDDDRRPGRETRDEEDDGQRGTEAMPARVDLAAGADRPRAGQGFRGTRPDADGERGRGRRLNGHWVHLVRRDGREAFVSGVGCRGSGQTCGRLAVARRSARPVRREVVRLLLRLAPTTPWPTLAGYTRRSGAGGCASGAEC